MSVCPNYICLLEFHPFLTESEGGICKETREDARVLGKNSGQRLWCELGEAYFRISRRERERKKKRISTYMVRDHAGCKRWERKTETGGK